MSQLTLFSRPLETRTIAGREFIRVQASDYELFRKFAKMRKIIAYDAFSTAFIHYWNKSVFRLYINSDAEETGELIPVVQKNKNSITYIVVDPLVKNFNTVLEICEDLSKTAHKGVFVKGITDNGFSLYNESELFEISGIIHKEFIYKIPEQVELTGSSFRSLRKRIKRFEKYSKLEVRMLTREDLQAHERFLDRWMADVGPSYFRASVVKDRNLLRFAIDGDDYDFTIGAFDGDELVGVKSCSIEPDTDIMCGIYLKCLRGYENLSQYLSYTGAKIGLERGAVYENCASASGSSPGIRKHKLSRRPFEFWNVYAFKYLGGE